MIERDVGELRAARDIADRKGAAVGRAQPRIDGDAALGRLDPGGGEVERGDVGAPPGRDQQMRARDALAAGEADDDAVSVALDAGDRRRRGGRDALRGSAAR